LSLVDPHVAALSAELSKVSARFEQRNTDLDGDLAELRTQVSELAGAISTLVENEQANRLRAWWWPDLDATESNQAWEVLIEVISARK
jgi:hypothetical protein